ncbi:TPA: 50S ribosomal protein L29 [Candidatus Woesearchaeota archaeon]|nr:50S ribosomal protein L29 [Candidatus Woesearchaeota archaeon]
MKELRALGDVELKARIAELGKELMKFGAQVATGTVPKSPGKIRKSRRMVARALTILQERRLKVKE